MNDSSEKKLASDEVSGEISGELQRIESQTQEARQQLIRLRQDVQQAEQRLNAISSHEIVEANENLVIAMLHAHAEAEVAAQTLKEVARAAETDALTELPNRTLLMDRLSQAIANAKRHQGRFAILYVDLDRFKQINDQYGHATGDLVLKRAAECMQGAVRGSDTVCRHGGDEFLILLAEVSRLVDVVRVADKVLAALDVPTNFGEHVLSLRASIGISIYPDDGDNADALIHCADVAMYRSKRDGMRQPVFFSQAPLPEATASVRYPISGGQDIQGSHGTRAQQLAPSATADRRSGQRRDADEHLVLAAQQARQLQGAAERAQRRQTEFLAVLAHEQRNALTPIRNAAALLGKLRIDEPMLPRMQAIIERQVVHMSRLVDDVLDISRVSTGKLRLERLPVDLNQVVEQAIDACRPTISARRQRLVTALVETPVMLIGDAMRLAQIFSNLLDNASKYTGDGEEIDLAVVVANGKAIVSLVDHGIGIAADVLPSIFDLFVQDVNAVGFKGAGLGIGLTVVRELVTAHAGTVTASSPGSGKGATFVVTLPLQS